MHTTELFFLLMITRFFLFLQPASKKDAMELLDDVLLEFITKKTNNFLFWFNLFKEKYLMTFYPKIFQELRLLDKYDGTWHSYCMSRWHYCDLMVLITLIFTFNAFVFDWQTVDSKVDARMKFKLRLCKGWQFGVCPCVSCFLSFLSFLAKRCVFFFEERERERGREGGGRGKRRSTSSYGLTDDIIGENNTVFPILWDTTFNGPILLEISRQTCLLPLSFNTTIRTSIQIFRSWLTVSFILFLFVCLHP